MWFSAFVQSMGWWLIPLVLVGGVFLLIRLYKTSAGKRAMDEVVMYVPVLGMLLRKIDTTRFARTLSALLRLGGRLRHVARPDGRGHAAHPLPTRRAIRAGRSSSKGKS